jgi:hypothetical protein
VDFNAGDWISQTTPLRWIRRQGQREGQGQAKVVILGGEVWLEHNFINIQPPESACDTDTDIDVCRSIFLQ